MRFRFLTSTPLDIRHGSGTYVGISVLARALESLGHTVGFAAPARRFPIYTAGRFLFNRGLRPDPDAGLTVGFDMDGYTIAGRGRPHIAALKGVIADEVRFESGLTAVTMGWQARCERLHVHRADAVVCCSRYSAGQAQSLYGLSALPAVVPELIELGDWRRLLELYPAAPRSDRFTVLLVGRFYRRKRVDVLLEAAARLRERIPGLEIRIVGNGPCGERLRSLWRARRLEDTVVWLGDVSRAALVTEYNRCDVFCLPSVQEAFGIVFLEAMAAGKPIVAARAGAAPEVVQDGVLVEPDSVEALADGLERLYRDADLRARLGAAGARRVEAFDAALVGRRFLEACGVQDQAVS